MNNALAERIAFRVKHKFKNSALSSLFRCSSSRRQTHMTTLHGPSYDNPSVPCSYRTRLEDNQADHEEEEPDDGDGTPLRRCPRRFEAENAWQFRDLLAGSNTDLSDIDPETEDYHIRQRHSIGSWTLIEAGEVQAFNFFRTVRAALPGEMVWNSDYSGSLGRDSRRGSVSGFIRTDTETREELGICHACAELLEAQSLWDMALTGCWQHWTSGDRGTVRSSDSSEATRSEEDISTQSSAEEPRDSRGDRSRSKGKTKEATKSTGPILTRFPNGPLFNDMSLELLGEELSKALREAAELLGEELSKALHEAAETPLYEKYIPRGR